MNEPKFRCIKTINTEHTLKQNNISALYFTFIC